MIVTFNAPWLPFLMMLLPANIMTMVMYAFRAERKHITESEERFRNAMEYSAIGMALVGIEGQWLQANKALCNLPRLQPVRAPVAHVSAVNLARKILNTDLEQLRQLGLTGRSIPTASKNATTLAAARWCGRCWPSPLCAMPTAPHSYFIAQIEDINDLKQTEWVNKRLMERITLANEAGGIGIWEWDLEPDVISWDKADV